MKVIAPPENIDPDQRVSWQVIDGCSQLAPDPNGPMVFRTANRLMNLQVQFSEMFEGLELLEALARQLKERAVLAFIEYEEINGFIPKNGDE